MAQPSQSDPAERLLNMTDNGAEATDTANGACPVAPAQSDERGPAQGANTPMRAAAPFGFYGFGNTGDEGTLQGFARLLEGSGRPFRVTMASQNPKHTRRVEPAFLYHQYHGHIGKFWPRVAAHMADAYVFAGGTPIQDGLGDWPLSAVAPMVEHGNRWGKSSVFVGIGVEGLTRESSRQIMRERIIPLTAFWSVRSERDRVRLLELGAHPDKVVTAADMAWLLPRADLSYGQKILGDALKDGKPLLGVNINAETALLARSPKFFDHLAAALDTLIEKHGLRVVFLFNETREEPTYDLAAAREVIKRMRHPQDTVVTPNTYLSPKEMMSLIGCCAATITTRYHFCLFSALQGVPFLALTRSDKVSDLCADLDWSHALMPEAIEPTAVAASASALIENHDVLAASFADPIEVMKGRAWKNLAALKFLSRQRTRRSGWIRRAWSNIVTTR